MKIIATHAQAYPKTCVGCSTHDREIMLSFMAEKGAIHYVFLTKDQAEKLIESITKELAYNASN